MSLDAAIFDMDGVVSDTAELHYRSWQLLFDDFLARYKSKNSVFIEPFTKDDHLRYLNGLVRYNGVSALLAARNIALPNGKPTDPPGRETICGLANQKNALFIDLLKKESVKGFSSTITLIKQLRAQSIKTAIVSSSMNCQLVLQKLAIEHLFDTRIDGSMLTDLGLASKPQPDMFIAAATQLKSHPSQALIVEDAIAGVQAGKAGQFKLVIGIARNAADNHALHQAGADLVVDDLQQLTIADLQARFS